MAYVATSLKIGRPQLHPMQPRGLFSRMTEKEPGPYKRRRPAPIRVWSRRNVSRYFK